MGALPQGAPLRRPQPSGLRCPPCPFPSRKPLQQKGGRRGGGGICQPRPPNPGAPHPGPSSLWGAPRYGAGGWSQAAEAAGCWGLGVSCLPVLRHQSAAQLGDKGRGAGGGAPDRDDAPTPSRRGCGRWQGTRGAVARTCPATKSCCQILTAQPPAVQLPAQGRRGRWERPSLWLSVRSGSEHTPPSHPSRHRSKVLSGPPLTAACPQEPCSLYSGPLTPVQCSPPGTCWARPSSPGGEARLRRGSGDAASETGCSPAEEHGGPAPGKP